MYIREHKKLMNGNGVLIYAKLCMNLKNMRSKRSQTQKASHFIVSGI